MQAAQAMSAYSDWTPQQYQEDEKPAATASAGTQQATDGAHATTGPIPEGQTAAEHGAATSGFTYDSSSGAPQKHAQSNFVEKSSGIG